MTHQMKPFSLLKFRANSMPLIKPPISLPRIHQLKRRLTVKQGQAQAELHKMNVLQHIQNREEEQLISKFKIIAERSIKKLEERYETIDRWKQKYLPHPPPLLIRQKNSSEDTSLNHMQISENQNTEASAIKRRLFPIPIQGSIHFIQSQNQAKKLQHLLKQRLQRHKKCIEVKNSAIQRQMKYATNANSVVCMEKRRELELKKYFLKLQQSREQNKFKINKLSKLHSQHNQQAGLRDRRTMQQDNLSCLKEKLWNETLENTPEGWQIDIDQLTQQQHIID